MFMARQFSCMIVAVLTASACAPEGTNAVPPATERDAQATRGDALNSTEPSSALNSLVEAFFDEQLELNPIAATFIGDHRFDNRLANSIGPEHRQASLALEHRYLKRLEEIDRSGLSSSGALTYETFQRDRLSAIEGEQYPSHLIPVNQLFSMPMLFAQLGSGASAQPFNTPEDYENFLGRIDDFVVWMRQAEENMRQGIDDGIVQPRVLMEKTLPILEAHVVEDVEQSVFFLPLQNLPESIPPGERKRLDGLYRAAIRDKVVPAYRALHEFVRDEYLSAARSDVGLWAMPGGRLWYDYLVRHYTTTDMSAEEIHRIGLDEVARLKGEMETLKREVGFEGDLQSFFEHLRTSEQFYYEEGDELLAHYRSLKEKVAAHVPGLFSRTPRADFVIRPVEEFRAASAAGASYVPPSADGTRPGIFYVNTHDVGSRPTYEIEAVYAHEAAPGHHFQIAIAQELEDLPRFRRFGRYTAYTEGWGLYAESLGPELGLYEDPYQRYGALSAEMWRAIRLVVDTGMHAKGWSREQALDYLMANVSISETEAVAEIERYIAIPGQALAYKIGQLKIMALRDKAARELGDGFDVRAFHAQVLEDGALPLDVLETKITRWIAELKS